jgi:insertion element IS1 protein InsB
MTPPAHPERYKNHRSLSEIISHGVWLYSRFPLSDRDVQDLLFERGIDVIYEAIRQWCLKFREDYANQLKHMIIDRSLNASGVRNTARSLPICPNTVLRTLKKQEAVLASANTAVLRMLTPAEVAWDLERVGEAEVDEMGSFVGNTSHPRWWWYAIDHYTGTVLAYVFDRRTDAVFVQRKTLLEPFGLTRYSTDSWGAYTRHLEPDMHRPGTRNTQQIERTHLTLRTRMKRLVRKTICRSKATQMHDIVTGFFVNRSAFGRAVSTWPSPLLQHSRQTDPVPLRRWRYVYAVQSRTDRHPVEHDAGGAPAPRS